MKTRKLTGDFIKDTPDNRKALEGGNTPYIVRYYDNETRKERSAVGVWSNGEFTYPFMKIRRAPKMEMVMGWCHVKGFE
jgi:hypothetical protein